MIDPEAFDTNMDIMERGLKYYIFDWDDNILHMPTKILLERRNEDGSWSEHPVSTSVFALVRNDTNNYRPPGGVWENAFINFRDLLQKEESAFLTDTKEALAPVIEGREKGAPSFYRFKRALIDGRIFGIVTARGHNSESLRAGVEYFIDKVLTKEERKEMMRSLRGYSVHFGEEDHASWPEDKLLDYYLGLNKYHAVTSPQFLNFMGRTGAGSENPEEAKQYAIKDFVDHVISMVRKSNVDKPVSIGFSDDDPGNVRAVENYIEQVLAREFPDIKFVVYDTSDPEVPKGRKIILQGQLELGLE